MNLDAFFIIGEYKEKPENVSNIYDAINKNILNLTKYDVSFSKIKQDEYLKMFGLEETREEDFKDNPEIIEMIKEQSIFINGFFKVASDIFKEINNGDCYSAFITWSFEMHNDSSGIIKYYVEGIEELFDRDCFRGLSVDYRIKGIIENNFQNIPPNLFIESNSDKFVYLNSVRKTRQF